MITSFPYCSSSVRELQHPGEEDGLEEYDETWITQGRVLEGN